MNPIITSLLDTDLYKFTMQQVVVHQYPNAEVMVKFVCRNHNIQLGFLAEEVRKQIDYLGELRLMKHESDYLSSYTFMKRDYVEWLGRFCLDPDLVTVKNDNGELKIEARGKWTDVILFEVFILAIVNELYYHERYSFEAFREEGAIRLDNKIDMLLKYPQVKVSEFGTRRRYSKYWQEVVLRTLLEKAPNNIVGTSNVHLAQKLGIRAHGTMAHEFVSAHLALVENIADAQKRAFFAWLQEYDADLGTALTDTFTTDAFFRDFGKVLSNGFSGLRHDSGCPYTFGRKAINHYKSHGIDPRTKSLIFSDGLTVASAIDIWRHFAGEIGLAFGIGTSLTNDISQMVNPLNIVMKLVECNGKPVVKLSDVPTKAIGAPYMVEAVKKAYGVAA